jgi:hypothetical protein
MRLLTWIVLIVVGFGFMVFVMTNLDSRVSITVGSTEYVDVRTVWVVAVSLIVGFLFTAVIALAEGARTRFENRRMKREVRKLETEINYLRTLPKGKARPEPDALETAKPVEPSPPEPVASDSHVPTAPVYGMDEDDFPPDPDDDLYSGGRAV